MALQTKTFTKAGDKGYGLKLVLTENSTSVPANTSSVSYSFSITRGGTGFYASQPFSWNITIGGQTITISGFKFQISTSDPAEQLIKSGTVTVAHNSDGRKTMRFSVSTPDASGISPTYGPTAMSMTGEWALTTIPRASTVTAANANIGSATTIKISRASAAFTHTLTYAFGSLEGTIATKTPDTTLSWTVPTSFYAQISKAKSGKCTITCQTFSGSTLIGTKTAEFQALVSEANAPAVTGTVADTNTLTQSLTGDSLVMVRYFSNALCTISAQGKNSAEITQKKIGETVVTGTTRTISGIEVNGVTFSATDSRGFTTRVNKTFSLVPYVKLTANGTVKRDTPTGKTGKLTLQGNYFNASFGAQSNVLTVQYRLQPEGEAYEDWQTVDVTLEGNTYRAAVPLTKLDYRKAYRVQVEASDKLMTTTADLTLLPGTPVFDWGKDDFAFHVPVTFPGGEMTDHVIATGATNNWRWRKWKSGIAECWKRLSVTADAFTSWGSMYDRTVPESRQTLPFPFSDTPKVVVQLEANSYNAWVAIWSEGGKADKNHTGAYRVMRPTALESTGIFILNYYAQGFYA